MGLFEGSKSRFVLGGFVALLAIFWVVLLLVAYFQMAPNQDLETLVTVPNIMTHLEKFEEIAIANSNTRAVEFGYNDSAAYVLEQLTKKTSFTVTTQSFFGITYTELNRPLLSQVFPGADPAKDPIPFLYDTDFRQPRYGGNGEYTRNNIQVVAAENEGCDASDYVGVEGAVALVPQTSNCSLFEQAALSEDAKALAMFFWADTLSNSRIRDWEEPGDRIIQIPVLSITTTLRNMFVDVEAFVDFFSNTSVQIPATINIFAETKEGKEDGLIVFGGSHLDSVVPGPGINDNGSGSATMLELALQLDKIRDKVVNKVRFGWWGAEEEGLLGSRYYVRHLPQEERDRIGIYINHDMLASPNYIIAVGNASDAMYVLEGGVRVAEMYHEYFRKRDIPIAPNQLRSGSDFVPFVENNISSTGLSAGAGKIKSSDERDIYGGIANAPTDPCYHQYCDTVANIDQQCLHDISQSSSNVMWELITKENLRSFLSGGSEENGSDDD